MTELNNTTNETETAGESKSKWTPLGFGEDDLAPHDGVPDYLATSLWAWIETAFGTWNA
jgi:hypothetical protein